MQNTAGVGLWSILLAGTDPRTAGFGFLDPLRTAVNLPHLLPEGPHRGLTASADDAVVVSNVSVLKPSSKSGITIAWITGSSPSLTVSNS